MNYGVRPWLSTARDPSRDDSMAPLPDAAGLRHLYPLAGTSHAEVALTNTWVAATDLENDAATQDLLCPPSLGTSYKSDNFSVTGCATGGLQSGSKNVCAGDLLATRFTLANYSTESADLTTRLFFSRDTEFSWDDKISPSVLLSWHSREIADLKSIRWEVPAACTTRDRPVAR